MTVLLPASERAQVIEAVTRLFVATDRKDWPAVRDTFSDEVFFDMSSLGGGPASVVSPQTITDGWQESLKGIPALHHQVGNFLVVVGADEAEVFCYGIAIHFPGGTGEGNTRTFVGSYDFHLSKQDGKWRIGLMAYHSKFVTGQI